MTPMNALYQLFKAPNYQNPDPGNAGTINVGRQLTIVPLVSAAAETRTLAVPTKDGIVVFLNMVTDGGDITLTVTSTFDGSNSTITFGDAGDWVALYSIQTAVGTFRWRILAGQGTNVAGYNASSASLSGPTLTLPTIADGLLASGSTSNDFSGSTGTFKTSTGATTIGGRTTFSKSVLRPCLAAVTGTASAAAALTADKDIILLLSVTTATTYGWTLPTGVAGMVLTLVNTAAYANTLIPASGGTINGLSPNAGVVIAASKCYIAVCSAADTWHVMEAAKATAA